MRYTDKLLLKLPDLTDYVQVEDLNENFTKIDTEIAKITDEETGVEAKLTQHLDENESYKTVKLNKDLEGIFTTIEHRRKTDDTLISKSVLSGGTSPKYTIRTVTYYESNGTTVRNTYTYALSYDVDGALVSEV